ncbi:hypothetical protein AAIE21_01045 [Paenibacillus sp. 102]|uniref:hypothetical protein n=1 Tax=Paenibacillus sp. 102 TaxID=3120823 RepID=UPI0031BA9C09
MPHINDNIYTERLSHKSIEITANIYSHITPKIIENEQGKYDAYYAGQEFNIEKSGARLIFLIGHVFL